MEHSKYLEEVKNIKNIIYFKFYNINCIFIYKYKYKYIYNINICFF